MGKSIPEPLTEEATDQIQQSAYEHGIIGIQFPKVDYLQQRQALDLTEGIAHEGMTVDSQLLHSLAVLQAKATTERGAVLLARREAVAANRHSLQLGESDHSHFLHKGEGVLAHFKCSDTAERRQIQLCEGLVVAGVTAQNQHLHSLLDCLQFCNGVNVGVGVGAGNVWMLRQCANVYLSPSLTRTTVVGQLTPILECRGEIHFRQRGHV